MGAGQRAVLVAAGLAASLVVFSGCGDVGDRPQLAESGEWPQFGRIPARTHYLEASGLNPPLRQVWEFDDRVLLEFPPALVDGRLYVADKYGNVRALDTASGDVVWSHLRAGPDANQRQPADVTAPTYAGGLVIVAYEHGEVVALDPAQGSVSWRTTLPSRLESSPIPVGDLVYLGSDDGVLFSLRFADGARDSAFRARRAIKASPSVDNGKLYFGDYGGTMYAVSADDERVEWSTDTASTPAGGDGGFYSSAAIAGGRVYAARDDGTVFALDAETGDYEWHVETGGAIYGSPALAPVSGQGLTVFIGSYDAHLYAIDATSGDVRWREVVGPVPGTATVIDNTVYTSSFQTGNTIGLDTRSRRRVFRYPSPGYTPMISDGVRLYLAGYESVHAFEPR